MPAILTHHAIMLLARERVRDLRDRLMAKKASAAQLTDLELRVLRLATLTFILLSDGDDAPSLAPDTPNDPAWPSGFGANASRYAVMGSMGPDIPGLAAIVAPGQATWFDTIHKGTPDANREQLNSRATDMALEVYRRSAFAMTDRSTAGPDAARAYLRDLNRIRAYALGHLTHIAGDVLAHPFIADVEWHVPSRDTPKLFNKIRLSELRKFGHDKVEGSLDSKVARDFFGRLDGPRSGQPWSAWWPPLDEVPPELFRGYASAFEEVYKASLNRPDGLRGVEVELRKLTLPTPDADFFRDGYRTLNHAGVGLLYDWGYGSWLGFLSVAILPLMATMPLALALGRGKRVFETSIDDAGERAAFEIFALPLAMNCLLPLAFGILASGKIWREAEAELTVGLIGAGLSTFTGLLALPFLFADMDPGAGWRWALLLILPAAIGLGMSVTALTKALLGEDRRSKLPLLFGAPFLIAAVIAVLVLLFAELIGNVGSETAGQVTWVVVAALLGVVLLIALFALPATLRDAKLPEKPAPFPATRPHHVRLFERSSLFELPGQHDATTTEAHYPSGVRPLLRLWWTGAGKRFVRPRHTHIEVVVTREDSNPAIVPAPITPMTLRQLAAYLPVAFRTAGHDGLQCALVHEEDADVTIPPGASFADLADLKEQDEEDLPESALSTAAADFKELTAENDKKSVVLFHAPKRMQAVRFDRFGPVPFDERETESVRGAGKVSGDGTRLQGAGTSFRFFFREGDRVVVNGSARVVTRVESDLVLVISSPFRPAPDGEVYERLGAEGEVTRGYTFGAFPHLMRNSGDSIMELAGDLGALLCLGGTSHMLDGTESPIADLVGMVDGAGTAIASTTLTRVQRVFGNWSLDRRLVEEWRELVTGGAVARGAGAADPGEVTLMQQGWIPTLRKWLQVVDDQGANAADAAAHSAGLSEPSNLALSQAIARLLDMPAPSLVTRGP
ncbi:MAG: hypothetical protein IPF98_21855 [Gemmatimonadetes bacterium]|nr:hypothetical protein [Gemmatimonadota bacterium]